MKNKKKKGNLQDKAMTLGMAGGGGVVTNVIDKAIGDSDWGKKQDQKLIAAIPLGLAWFAYDYVNPAFAMGMAGAAGGNLGKEFGIGDIGEDDLSGLDFQEVDETTVGNAGDPLMGTDNDDDDDDDD